MRKNHREKAELLEFVFQIHIETGHLVNGANHAKPQHIKRRVVAGKVPDTLLQVAHPMAPERQIRREPDSVQHHEIEQNNQQSPKGKRILLKTTLDFFKNSRHKIFQCKLYR